ncbi:MAG TPA: M13 family metallopeptidase, partial [Thermoanaerobaculia bacterium]|nr:M13 family metallopeptidase [Thermoanaerobaculia bacterium]
NPRRNIAQFAQGGLGLPDRDYYVSKDPKKKAILEKYPAHIATMLSLIGESKAEAAKHAKEIVAFETKLAEVSKPRDQLRDPDKNYHKIDRAGLEKLSPELPWKAFFDATGYPEIKDINVVTPKFFQKLNVILAETNPAVLREYLRWHLAQSKSSALSDPFVNASFDFYGKLMRGQEQIEPRWKRCVDYTNRALGEAVGKVYVKQKFPGESKAKAEEMVRDIEAAFESNLPQLDWMDAATRKKAEEKVAALANMIGYPNKWRDYSSMTVVPDNFFADSVAASEYSFNREAKKIGNPVDRSEWFMNPQTVNAYNDPTQNEIVFPAGILQPPFFNKDFPAAMNYGGIGAVVGHELTHGFDDQGRKFDAEGRLREWWSPTVAKKFEKRAECVRNQYSSYEVEPGVHVNGKLTAGENIADIGGLKESYVAFQNYQKRHGDKREIPQLTNDQLFFVAFAQNWCSLATPQVLRMQVTVDPHSPTEFRAIGAVSDNPYFAKAFNCKAGDPMVPKNQCVVW